MKYVRHRVPCYAYWAFALPHTFCRFIVAGMTALVRRTAAPGMKRTLLCTLFIYNEINSPFRSFLVKPLSRYTNGWRIPRRSEPALSAWRIGSDCDCVVVSKQSWLM